jgi:copper transport protein
MSAGVRWPLVLTALTAALVLTLAPVGARAHASLISSTPTPGARLASGPGVVILNFSEPINPDLSQAAVTGPDGRRFERTAVASHTMTVQVAGDRPGLYEVQWTAVSAVDGHVLTGSFRFGVDVNVPDVQAGTSAVGSSEPDLPAALFRGIEDAALLTGVGLVLLALLREREPRVAWAKPGRRMTAVMAVALAGGTASVAAESLQLRPGLTTDALVSYFGNGLPGMGRAFRLAAEVVGLGLSLRRPEWAAPALVAALAAVAASGHAAATQPVPVSIAVEATHLVAAGAWAGGIMALVTFRPPGGWFRGEGIPLLNRFARPAVAAFLVTAVTGVIRGGQQLSEPWQLVTTAYGGVLVAKVLAVAAMVLLSLLASRRRFVALRLEGALALTVVAAAALLTAFPLPPAQLDEATASRQAGAALPSQGDLTVGLSAGDVVTGLTLRPAQPGRNEVWLTVLPVNGEQAAARLPVSLRIDGSAVGLRPCGPGCRTGTAELRGGETLDLRVGGVEGGTATFTLPQLPPADAGGEMEAITARMGRLQSVRVKRTLRPAAVPLVARYAFEAPDRMSLDVSTGEQAILMGPDRYSRDGPSTPWKREAVPPIRAPAFPWDSQPLVAARVLGSDDVDGVPVQVLSFFSGTAGAPVWMRLWADSGGLVRRVEMRARAHIMDDRNYDFDAPIAIAAPDSG